MGDCKGNMYKDKYVSVPLTLHLSAITRPPVSS